MSNTSAQKGDREAANEPIPRNIALILAGGIGARTNLSTPKQFIVVDEKPIIVHTLEVFNRTWQIDDIVVVVLDGWQTIMNRYIEEFKLDKVRSLVTGGTSGQESINRGLQYLVRHYSPDDIIVIHDAVRPLVTEDIITNSISGVLRYGSAITIVPATEALLFTKDWATSEKEIDRLNVMRTQTPQSLRLKKLIWAHEEAEKRNIRESIATCSLLIRLGEKVHFINGVNSNFKITTGADLVLFEAYLWSQETRRP